MWETPLRSLWQIKKGKTIHKNCILIKIVKKKKKKNAEEIENPFGQRASQNFDIPKEVLKESPNIF